MQSKLERASTRYKKTPHFKREAAAVGQRLREIRETQGLTLARVAELSYYDAAALGKLEAGNGNVSLATLGRLSIGLQQPIAVFFGGHVLTPPTVAGKSIADIFMETEDKTHSPPTKALMVAEVKTKYRTRK